MKAFLFFLFTFSFLGCVTNQDSLIMENCIDVGMVKWKDSLFKGVNNESESIQRKLVMEKCAKGER